MFKFSDILNFKILYSVIWIKLNKNKMLNFGLNFKYMREIINF